MKKTYNRIILAITLVLTILSIETQAQSTCFWAKKTGGNYEDAGTSVAIDASGNVFSLGYFYSSSISFTTTASSVVTLNNNYGGSNMYLAKYDSCGNFLWAKQAFGHDGGSTIGAALTTDAAGNVYVTGNYQTDTLFLGTTYLVKTGGVNAFIAKYNASGVVQWAKTSTGNSQDMPYAITIDASTNIYIAGYFNSTAVIFGGNSFANGTNDSFTNDVFVAKFDNSGNNLWVNGSTSNKATSGDAKAYGIGLDGANNVYVAGSFGSAYIRFGTDSLANAGYNDIFMVKYNTSGVLQWLKSAGSTDDDAAYGLTSDASGNVYITGQIGASSTVVFGTSSITNNAINPTAFLAKYNTSGTAQWGRVAQGDHYSYNVGNSVTLDALGNPYIIGSFSSDSLQIGAVRLYNTSYTNGSGGGDYYDDVFAAKYKSNGVLSWARSAGGDSSDVGISLAVGANNSVCITGEFFSPTMNIAGIALAGTNSAGDAFVSNAIATSFPTPAICMVSVDTLSLHNVITWDKTAFTNVSKFIIYREVSTNIFKAIGNQPFNALSQYTDTAKSIGPTIGDPNVGSNKYKIQILDTAGTYSKMSPYHSTIYISGNGSGTFSWPTNYTVEGQINAPDSIYVLSCDTLGAGIWTIVATQSGSQQSISDPGFIHHATTAKWRVDALGFNCFPTLRMAGNNSVDLARVRSHSNQNNNRQSGIKTFQGNDAVQIYPNPGSGIFYVETSMSGKQLCSIYDVRGNLVFSQSINTSGSVDLSSLTDGVYTMTLLGTGSVANKRLVIVK